MSMLSRFQGNDSRLVEALGRQVVLCGNPSAVQEVARVVALSELEPGDTLIHQDATDTDVYFVLSGGFRVFVNGREVATRKAGQHLGEMAVIDPGSRRTATVIASEKSVVAKLSEQDFLRIADQHPALWRAVALELCHRLDERRRFHATPNKKPIVFIGSSTESRAVAEAIKAAIPSDVATCTLWSHDVFGVSSFPIDDLETAVAVADFAVLVMADDDRVRSRRREQDAPRDNVVFELGLFMGGLSRKRVFLITPEDVDVKIPSDLLGINRLKNYVPNAAGVPDVSAGVDQLIAKILDAKPK